MTKIIAEIGNNHEGNMDRAKELIRVAHASGADLVKMQAYQKGDVKGSMPSGFYEKCRLQYLDYVELIDYGRQIGTDVFYSIFSEDLRILNHFQKWRKIAGSQSQKNIRDTESQDSNHTFVSVNPKNGMLPEMPKSWVLYVSEYMTQNPRLSEINFLREYYGKPIGYSDHTIGIEYCLEAIREYGCPIIEKHFTLTRDITYEGKQFRDAVHGALPYELERLAKSKKEH